MVIVYWADLTSTLVRRFVLFCRGCGGDSFQEDLRCGPKLGVLVALVELDGVGVTFNPIKTGLF